MKNTFYKYDKTNVTYQQLSSFKNLLLNHTWVVILAITLAVMIPTIIGVCVNTSYKKEVKECIENYETLTQMYEAEIDTDTLHMKIAHAYLEGNQPTPTDDSVIFSYICECRAWYPEVIMAQYKLESANGKSDLAVNAFNFFGMKAIDQSRRHRPTTQIPFTDYKGYGVYKNWKLSILDKILWERDRMGNIKPSREKYIAAHSCYAEDTAYFEKINAISKNFTK